MDLLTQLADATSQAVASAPMWLQVVIMLLTVVPALVVVAWVLMLVIDWCARRFHRRPGQH